MTANEIREVVKITIEELTGAKLLTSDSYRLTLRVTELRLNSFFSSEDEAKDVSAALRKYIDDPYIDVIFLQYRDGLTLEEIANTLGRDLSTIKRNKKRLITAIYNELDVYVE